MPATTVSVREGSLRRAQLGLDESSASCSARTTRPFDDYAEAYTGWTL
ncbi:hypothetical protein [Microbacterium gubbeenense]|uniref:Uncharacterized protein n=1 Tax=Candidatus Microbacterium stercoravium TaxID=2838697 RepID=A0A9D2H4N9_9MICO|nr:hypothetical protein [Microbacterium gubbeenense]HJA03867.1 hypothetical protein [Candidatus Microbacterium stercoravium]